MLDYDPGTGVFVRRRTGRVSACVERCNERYARVNVYVDGRSYRAHRLAWLYVYGRWPTECIDHIDGNPCNNAIANLRVVSLAYNQQNRRRANHSNKGKLLGASHYKSRKNWMARIYAFGKQHFIGYYATAREAHEAYMAAKRNLHPGAEP